MTTEELARWIVEHGAHKPRRAPAEVGVPLYIEEYPAEAPEKKKEREVEYTIEF